MILFTGSDAFTHSFESRVYTIKVFLVKVSHRKLGQSVLRQDLLFTRSKLFEELVQQNHGKCMKKSSKYVNISHLTSIFISLVQYFLCIAILGNHSQNVLRILVDLFLLLNLDQYFLLRRHLSIISPFYFTFNNKNRENIIDYHNTLFWLADPRQSPSKFQGN